MPNKTKVLSMIPMKYIRTRSDSIVVFPADLQHSEFGILDPVSAGFIVRHKGRLVCFGESTSLGISSIGTLDSALANQQFR